MKLHRRQCHLKPFKSGSFFDGLINLIIKVLKKQTAGHKHVYYIICKSCETTDVTEKDNS